MFGNGKIYPEKKPPKSKNRPIPGSKIEPPNAWPDPPPSKRIDNIGHTYLQAKAVNTNALGDIITSLSCDIDSIKHRLESMEKELNKIKRWLE